MHTQFEILCKINKFYYLNMVKLNLYDITVISLLNKLMQNRKGI
jgi:hypothetical protein